VCAAYEYVADSEEATLSQSESVRSVCSVDDAEFRSKTQQFFEGMARLKEEVEAEQQKTHTVSRSFYPRRVSDNVSHRTDFVLDVSSALEQKLEPSGAEMYATFSNKLLVPGLGHPPDRRRSASSATEKRISLELEQFLRPDRTERSLSVMSTPSTLQRPSSRQSESEESISMVDVTWQHRKPAVRRRRRPRPKLWEETEAETLSTVRTRKLKEKNVKDVSKQQETIRLMEVERQKEKSRWEEIGKQLEMVEQQERKIKEELTKQQKMLQQFTALRQREIERERIQDFVRQQELLKEQEAVRKQEITRLSELQKQHKLAKQLVFPPRQTEVEQTAPTGKVIPAAETQDETNLISIDISLPMTAVKSELQTSTEDPITSLEAVELSVAEDGSKVKSHKLEVVGERTLEMPLFSTDELLETRQDQCHVESTLADELVDTVSFSSPPSMKAVENRDTLISPTVKCVNVRAVLPVAETLSLPVLEDGTMASVATEIIHSEQLTEILTPQDVQVVELVEKSFDTKPANASETASVRHSQSSEDDVFYDASDVDVQSLRDDVMETGEVMPTGSLLMAPVFELPLADVTAFDGAGAILECRVAGNPTPEVMWFVNGVEIRSMPPEVTVSCHAGVCRLVVVDVMPDDEGEYTVRAINEAGSCLTSAYLTVLRKLDIFMLSKLVR